MRYLRRKQNHDSTPPKTTMTKFRAATRKQQATLSLYETTETF